MKGKQHGLQILIAVDQLANTLLGGWADETLSSRTYRNARYHRGWATIESIINGIFFWQENHCKEAYMSEQERTQLPPKMRDDDPETM